jgi:predicted naringenin-chalcone synthase
MSFAILGLGTALPPTWLSQTEAMQVARTTCCHTPEQATWLPPIYAGTGIDKRHYGLGPDEMGSILDDVRKARFDGEEGERGPGIARRMGYYQELAPPLAVGAARRALDQSRLPADSVTHLVTVSCTGFRAPGVDVALIRELELAPTVLRTHVGFMGCHGALNGLRVARAFTESDPAARVLLCAVELCVLHYHFGWEPQKLVANALFADGAAAVVGTRATEASAEEWQVVATGSCLFPDSEDDMTWSIGDYNFEMTLSKRVPGLIAGHLRPWLEKWLGDNQLILRAVASWAIHPGGPRILAAVEESLDLDDEDLAQSRAVLREYGNMSSPTLLFILDRLRTRRAPRPCVALGFGPGLVAEAALLR